MKACRQATLWKQHPNSDRQHLTDNPSELLPSAEMFTDLDPFGAIVEAKALSFTDSLKHHGSQFRLGDHDKFSPSHSQHWNGLRRKPLSWP